MSGTPNQQLQNMLNQLATQIGPTQAQGLQSAYYQDVYNAITSSPSMLAAFNTAATNGTINGFYYTASTSST